METKKRSIVLPIILNIILTILLIASLFLCVKLNNEANKIDTNNFTASDIKKYFTKRKLYLVISLLSKNGIIELTKTEKNKKFYKLSE